MTDAIQRFLALLQSSDTLIEQATKEDVAEVARVLALHVAHYRRRFGDIPVEESLALFKIEKLDDDTAGNLADGVEVLIELLKALTMREARTNCSEVGQFCAKRPGACLPGTRSQGMKDTYASYALPSTYRILINSTPSRLS